MKRIQRQRTRGWRMPEGAVYVGRRSRWGSPFHVGQPFSRHLIRRYPWLDGRLMSRADTVVWFQSWLRYRLAWDAEFTEPLRGKDLVCWCPLDQPCHADVLLELANR